VKHTAAEISSCISQASDGSTPNVTWHLQISHPGTVALIDTSPYPSPEVPSACQEMIGVLEHQFSIAYVSLARLMEEYRAITRSTVCEEAAQEEYSTIIASVQAEASTSCERTQTQLAGLERHRSQLQNSAILQKRLQSSIQILVAECGSLEETQTDLDNIWGAIEALGQCPGLTGLSLQVPVWAGEWVVFRQERWESDAWNDAAMLEACRARFGTNGIRVAEVSEIDAQTVRNAPVQNTAGSPVLGACPLCEGDDNDGLSRQGHGRICWDPSQPFDRNSRRADCSSGPRAVMCVSDHHDTIYPAPAPPPFVPPSQLPPEPGIGTFLAPQALMDCPGGAAVAATECMSLDDYVAIEDGIRQIMGLLGDRCGAEECPQADWAGCVLRMAGHDFMDFDSTSGHGGSDACTNMDDPDNRGLQECLAHGEFGFSLRDVYHHHCTRISLADFIVIAAEAVMTVLRDRVRASNDKAAVLRFRERFLFGRTTAVESCRFEAQRLPNPEIGCSDVTRVFIGNLGLDARGAAALMGVHTIGRARIENSGYSGFWSDPENSRLFNNNYYVSLLVKGWLPLEVSNGKRQWARSDEGMRAMGSGAHEEMMLNTDVCLAYVEDGQPLNAAQHGNCCAWMDSFTVGGDSTGRHSGAVRNNNGLFCGVDCATDAELNAGAPPFSRGCDGGVDERRKCCGAQAQNDCGDPSRPAGFAFEAIREFAASEVLWIAAFQDAWKQVTERGTRNLRPLGQCTPPPQ